MGLDSLAIIVSVCSLAVAAYALSVSIKRYELQAEQHELQKKDFEEKYKSQLHIKDEQFLSSHVMGPGTPEYYVKRPEEIEFEYRAKYVNRGAGIICIESLVIIIDAIGAEEVPGVFASKIIENTHIAQNEEYEVCHRIRKDNVDGIKRHIEMLPARKGILEFSVLCTFSGKDGIKKEHKRTLYRMSKEGGDVSYKSYSAGRGFIKRSFVY